MNMHDELFQSFCKERNLSPGSVKVYHQALKKYTSFNGMTLQQLLDDAIEDEKQHVWRERKLLNRLIDFRNYLIEQGYAKEYIQTTVRRVKTFYINYFVEIHSLPRANIMANTEIKIPTREDLKTAVDMSKPLMKALILFLISTGLSKIDCLNLTIKDFITATKEYHTSNDIYEVLKILQDREDVVPTFSLTRQKTGKFHYTFCSPEAVIAIVNYLQSRSDKLTNDSSLFKISYHWLTVKFQELNDSLNLGVTQGNEFRVLRCHTLRKYHATTLRNDGLDKDIVNSFQGKAKNRVDAAYFVDTPEALRKRYIEHVDCLTVHMDIRSIDLKSPEYIELETENNRLKEVVGNIDERIEARIADALSKVGGPMSNEEFDDLFS